MTVRHSSASIAEIATVAGIGLRRILALVLCALAAAAPDTFAADGPVGPERRSARLPHQGPDRALRPEPKILEPYALRFDEAPRAAPTTGTVRPHAEYAPMAGVLFQYDRFGWPDLVAEMVAELTRPGYDETAWVLVANDSQRNHAQNRFGSAGADLAKVVFVTIPTETIWLRDYGPQFIRLDETIAVVDLRYFAARPNDNYVPKLLAEDPFLAPSYNLSLFHFGGNYLGLHTGHGFAADIVTGLNQDFGSSRVIELFAEYHGIHTLHLFPTLPASVDPTGHIDMWLQFADADTVVIGEFLPGSDSTAITITNNAAAYMQAQGFEVFRVPALNDTHPWEANTHFTYTNGFRVNDRIFVPVYGSGGSAHAARDAEALATWQLAAPDAEIVPIDAWELIYAAGSVHCVVMQVPRFTATEPAASLLSPSARDILVPGETRTISWAANDDEAVTGIDLLYSTDGGAAWSPIALGEAHDGRHDWVVPFDPTDAAQVKVVARDSGNRIGEATASTAIVDAAKRRVDFAGGAGVDRWAWGTESASWADLSGLRRPPGLGTELSGSDYIRIATSDAVGGNSDSNRYRSPTPSSGATSTHLFEFTVGVDPALVLELGFEWEGYGDSCVQVEMYLWDEVAGDWCDGIGDCGPRRYLDVASGNADQRMHGSVRQDVERYIDADGRVALLVYTVPAGRQTFHDYVAMTVTHLEDADGDSVPDGEDCIPNDGNSWEIPGEVPALQVDRTAGSTRVSWTAPADLGGTSVGYDLLAAPAGDGFPSATCLIEGTDATEFDDADPLAPHTLRAFLVRATNACGDGGLGPATTGDRPNPVCQ